MLTEIITDINQPRYFRYTLKNQNNRIEYRVCSDSDNGYYTVQMKNGRGINCYTADGKKCASRAFYPGVACKHMEFATKLEQDRRMAAQAAAATSKLPESVREVIKIEQAKCQQVWRDMMAAPITAKPQSKRWYTLARKREQAANKALNLQRTESQRVIDEAVATASFVKEVA